KRPALRLEVGRLHVAGARALLDPAAELQVVVGAVDLVLDHDLSHRPGRGPGVDHRLAIGAAPLPREVDGRAAVGAPQALHGLGRGGDAPGRAPERPALDAVARSIRPALAQDDVVVLEPDL